MYEMALKGLESELKNINKYLSGRDWLVGDSLTAADFILAANLTLAFTLIFGLEFRQKHCPHVASWFDKITRLPSWVAVHGYVKMCTVPISGPT